MRTTENQKPEDQKTTQIGTWYKTSDYTVSVTLPAQEIRPGWQPGPQTLTLSRTDLLNLLAALDA